MTRPAAGTPVAPRAIGRYEVERLLGQGGMGRVWLARDTVLGRKVAIKVLRDDLALPPTVHEELVERMRHEARAAAAVSHPSIVTLHDMGEDAHVGLFLVFEYVAGESGDAPESLRERLRRGPLHLKEVARLARELGAALTFAHDTGVIHRDVKPENILFSRTGPKIADFGIARIPESTITRANMVLGTPAYTSPEALSNGDFGAASDQFALAATLYEATTAARAFGGEDAIITAGKVSNEPPPPIHESIAPEGVLGALERALQRGMAKDPNGRFPSCADLGIAVANAIEKPHTSEVIEIERTPLSSRLVITEKLTSDRPPPGETPRPSIFIRKKNERVQNIVAGIALLVIIGLIVFGRRSTEAPNALTDAAASAAGASSITAGASSITAGASPVPRHAKPRPAPSASSSAGNAGPNAPKTTPEPPAELVGPDGGALDP